MRFSLSRVPATARSSAYLGGRTVNTFTFYATRACVNNGVLLRAACAPFSRFLYSSILHLDMVQCPLAYSSLREYTISSLACCAQYFPVFVAATPPDTILLQPSALHFLSKTLTIPSWACCARYFAVLVPTTPNDGCCQSWGWSTRMVCAY